MAAKKELSSREKKLHELLFGVFKHGYTKNEIVSALDSVEAEVAAEEKKLGIFAHKLTAAQILLFIGGIITVLGGVFLVAISWEYWNSFFRILAIFLPFFATLSIGVILKRAQESSVVATFFAITSALLFPLLLIIFFQETALLENAHTALQGAIYSVLSTAYIIALALYFRSVVWGIFYTVGIFTSYYFFIDYTNFELLGPNTIFWGALTLGLFIVGYCYWLGKKGLQQYIRYPLLVTLAVSLFSLIFMLFPHPLSSSATWYLLLPVFIYFMIAAFIESENFEDIAKSLYFLSLFALTLMLFKLSLGGRLVNFFGLDSSLRLGFFDLRNEDYVGSSFAIAGLILFGVRYLASYIKRFKLVQFSQFGTFIEFIAVWSFLGGLFFAGLGDKKIMHELLFGASSFAAMFYSTVRQSRTYLYSGTVFLIVFIFSFGGEYFGDTIGWPITLLISGILAMLTGYFMGKLQKQFTVNTEE